MKRITILLALATKCPPLVIGFASIVVVPQRRGVVRRRHPSPSSLLLHATASEGGIDVMNDIASRLLRTCDEYGRVGSRLTEYQRKVIDDLAISLAPYSDIAPAESDLRLRGRHDLIYSASPGPSSGALGPLVGTVSQSFVDEVRYINRVELFGGLVKIELYADRKALSESKVRVKFNETAFYLLGNEVKRGEAKGSGVWEYIFSGFVTVDGERILLRVMKTPSTFVIAQRPGNGG